jgi:RNA polymerase sigma-70 factor, ECF subfamily
MPIHRQSAAVTDAPPAASDQILIARIAVGDRSAMRTLFMRHSCRVRRFASRFVADPVLAEDVTSDTFLDIWRQAGRYQGRCSVPTWILSIARHKALSARKRRGEVRLDDAISAAAVDPAPDPDLTLQAKDIGAVLRRCVARLPPAHAQVIDLVYYRDKTINEVATIVGISENTAKTRAFHARQRLAKLLLKAGIDRDALPAFAISA